MIERPETVRLKARQLYVALSHYYEASTTDRDTLAALLDEDIGRLNEVVGVLFWLSREHREVMVKQRRRECPRTGSERR